MELTGGSRSGIGFAARTSRLAALVFMLLLSLATVASGARTRASVVPQLGWLHVGAPGGPAGLRQIVDAHGRETLLRGVNVSGLRDDYVANGSLRPPYPEDPAAYQAGACPGSDLGVYMAPFCERDAAEIAGFGYDVVRLTVSWSLLEPSPGRIDQTYIERIAQAVAWLRAAGVYTVIDLHNDAWSKYVYTPRGSTCPPLTQPIGGFHEADGAPAWASTHLSPVCAVKGIRDLDLAVQEGFQRLYSDIPGPDGIGLQEHYAAVVSALAARFAGDPAVAGYELLNEPEPGFLGPGIMDAAELFPFYAKVIRAVRAHVPSFRQLFFIEPDVTRNILDRSVVIGPWSLYSPYRNVVYAPHIYTGEFTLNAEFGLPALDPLFPSNGGYDSAAQDARSLGMPLWSGEFGNDVSKDRTLLRASYANQDRLAVGGALWYWKGFANLDGHWSVLYDDSTHIDAPYPTKIALSDRAYPLYVAGTIQSLAYDPDTGSFALSAASSRVRPGDDGRATVLHIPIAAPGRVTASGAALAVGLAPGGGRLAFVYPRGGRYAVSLAAR